MTQSKKNTVISYSIYFIACIAIVTGGVVASMFSRTNPIVPTVNAAGTVYTNEQLTDMIIPLINHKNDFLNKTYPIGSIYITSNSTNPSVIVGGTWVSYGKGQTLVGIDTSQTEFNTVNKTGGSKTATHSHGAGAAQNGSLAAAVGSTSSNASYLGFLAANYFGGMGDATYTLTATGVNGGGFNHFTQIWGNVADASPSVVQPYITVYMWRRTA